LTPVVKSYGSDMGFFVANQGVQVYGGYGYIADYPMEQILRDSRIAPLFEGTNGIQALDLVSRKIAGERGATMRAVLAQAADLDARLAERQSADLVAVRTRLVPAVRALADATEWVIDASQNAPRDVAASAVPYLELAGTTLGGIVMAKAALRAATQLESGQGDAAFYRTKLRTARFYAEHVLPMATALAQTVISGASATLAVADAEF
ncbi:MAG: acyl-CoA dehydrogenase, partial [Betaproteobacteria bacterium]